MTTRLTEETSNLQDFHLKVGLYNAENLFLLFDKDNNPPTHFLKLTEAQWQKHSTSVYENKSLAKCIEIAKIIKNESPDIMMLCEVGGLESLKNFNHLFLNDIYDVALIEGNSDRNIDVGFLIKKSCKLRYQLNTNKNRPLNFLYQHESLSQKTGYKIKHSTHLFSRDCAELFIYKDNLDDPSLIILLTHLKSRLDPEKIDPGGTERRTAELRTCLEIYKEKKLKFPKAGLIFAGDMNGFAGKPETDEEFKILYNETDLEDILEVAGVTIDNRSTFYQIKNNGSKVEGKQIDYCFVSKNLHSHIKPNLSYVYKYKDEFGFALDKPRNLEQKSNLPSDHYPLFFTLESFKL